MSQSDASKNLHEASLCYEWNACDLLLVGCHQGKNSPYSVAASKTKG